MKPEISVIIPTFRRPEPLAAAIESVLAQTGAACEIIVIDDCPDGGAEPVARRYAGCGLTYLRSPAPSGGRPALVRNFGLPHARAGIIHFLDDDDLAPEGYYAEALEVFASRPDIGVVFGKVEPFGDIDVSSERDFFEAAFRRARRCSRLGPKLGFSAAMFFQRTLLICSAGMVRKSCVEAIGGFDPEPSLAEDVDFFARAIRHSGAYLLDRTSIHYRIGPSLMRLPDRQPLIDSSYRAIHSRYRREHGAVDFYALKTFAKILDRLHA
ncbi:glycosyltransferase [Rhodoblastus acidophilus]|uniref:Glycosyltransferase n=1 Tax=Candidatus Rhodoblastus alkanivorans TaxID=2954117 RepID=A0ABS9ZAU1_9HYPH|nr:glycosyltransferase family 2 protein [Candidatus Rhodoblastus alkanivorans]MCI4679347.1 glycosyltransferase [Candidatus Rhodoblastus alkanivorans]MCI4684823.1 glycosyltransferase [Candidatus Rhodoblastus alkanivorans]MDI4642147.1 glycosyltransferase [Rhodoblastus acidophilus]